MKKIATFLFLLSGILPAISQPYNLTTSRCNHNRSKNHIEVNFSTLISKTNFNENIKKESSSYFKNLAKNEPLAQFYVGTGYGIKYYRKVGSNMVVGIGLNYRKYGQQSESYFGLVDKKTKKMEVVLSSYEIPIVLRYKLLEYGKVKIAFNFEPIFNIYHTLIAKDFRYIAILKKDYGCCEEKYFHATGAILNELNRHIDTGLWRIGVSIGSGFQYMLFRNLSIIASPSLNFYTGFFKKEIASHVADDWIFSFNTDVGFNYNF